MALRNGPGVRMDPEQHARVRTAGGKGRMVLTECRQLQRMRSSRRFRVNFQAESTHFSLLLVCHYTHVHISVFPVFSFVHGCP